MTDDDDVRPITIEPGHIYVPGKVILGGSLPFPWSGLLVLRFNQSIRIGISHTARLTYSVCRGHHRFGHEVTTDVTHFCVPAQWPI